MPEVSLWGDDTKHKVSLVTAGFQPGGAEAALWVLTRPPQEPTVSVGLRKVLLTHRRGSLCDYNMTNAWLTHGINYTEGRHVVHQKRKKFWFHHQLIHVKSNERH